MHDACSMVCPGFAVCLCRVLWSCFFSPGFAFLISLALSLSLFLSTCAGPSQRLSDESCSSIRSILWVPATSRAASTFQAAAAALCGASQQDEGGPSIQKKQRRRAAHGFREGRGFLSKKLRADSEEDDSEEEEEAFEEGLTTAEEYCGEEGGGSLLEWRLVTAGLHGVISEWNLRTLAIQVSRVARLGSGATVPRLSLFHVVLANSHQASRHTHEAVSGGALPVFVEGNLPLLIHTHLAHDASWSDCLCVALGYGSVPLYPSWRRLLSVFQVERSTERACGSSAMSVTLDMPLGCLSRAEARACLLHCACVCLLCLLMREASVDHVAF